MKLLVVDDDRDLVELLDYALRREGYEVARAYDGEAALETLNREHPDLVVDRHRAAQESDTIVH